MLITTVYIALLTACICVINHMHAQKNDMHTLDQARADRNVPVSPFSQLITMSVTRRVGSTSRTPDAKEQLLRNPVSISSLHLA